MGAAGIGLRGLVTQLATKGTKVTKGLGQAVGTKKSYTIANMLKSYAEGVGKNPITYGVPMTAAGIDIGVLGAEMGHPVYQAAVPEGILAGRKLRETAAQELGTQEALRSVRERSKQLRESIRRNIQVIAQTNPQLYNELVAGKRLPRGAVVLGGPPRRDLLEEVATMMAGV